MIGVVVLGSTGSIGTSTLDVIARHPDRYQVMVLAANTSVDAMWSQVEKFKPPYVVMVDPQAAGRLREKVFTANLDTEVLSGSVSLETVVALPEVDTVMAAIVGAAGLGSSLAAARAGKRVLLANKESLVLAGSLFMRTVKENGARLLPIDSEHNALFQCMPAPDTEVENGIRRLLLTASGGPFRLKSLSELQSVTPEEACAHPNWDMGKKISVDSATMMNKGLEVIEARWLFDVGCKDIQVVVHPQSVIHSMVEYVDGSVLAQMGNPDMRTPIAHALAWPERITSGVASLDLFEVARLDFEAPDFERFRCLQLAYDAISSGGVSAAVLNAANEIAVDAFLQRKLTFTDIPVLIEETLADVANSEAESIAHLVDVDRESRSVANQHLARRG
ncbi:1-deoxy-D-xylulose-5-phosphate reductoisomerase [Solemya velum gill symbiont]|uniref:1-deoxy-D-xylulose-5-phosphate reductoisomerase n=1 Tax=Solemya velum gill symbiont TaxID=2340 RepID=UPI00099745D1|nr:1-deoxy-D-xylulose-5-phosphate reductoisomerase [Solemya velum gill symbiont]OOZ00156.1 1-deoxy-D-xylulose-5-phosphate reductoisomerase [Solemya velum gill symbiont]OOZ02315.1 1-deoxy-D-xylulose-5-phosphate reductoisomerase [Solemya velum gill symbiont]OOZ04672.1 1-deoxy-D-xylulose-5-phosphate reductoisomerase [Solemya velum gill symbiont]OOZ06912.1 1-deoxy-D-xylulose-5-phosphate reductoisomerase [Solemya velum gill symbiont]OOZ09094.1 1-deoxy-D-xylulose-5-phosphate reductoisomerase [Solemy